MMDPDDKKITASLMGVLRTAGKAIMQAYRADYSVEYKDDDSPLTIADKRSHEILVAFLKDHYPFPVLSEEGGNVPHEERRLWKNFWLLDPLDGTREFLKKNDEFTVNIALVHQDRPVLGIIYVPAKNILYYASRGAGGYKIERGRTIRLPLGRSEKGLIVVGSRSHSTPQFDEYVKNLWERHRDLSFKSAGSALKFCLVAEGSADIYPRLGPTMEWDTAAGQVIVEESGGSVVDAELNTPLMYNKPNLQNPYFIAFGSTYHAREQETADHNFSLRRNAR